MQLTNLIKDISKIDTEDICSDWQWLLKNQKSVILVSSIGDIFLLGNDDSVYWLQTDGGILTKVAENVTQFEIFLSEPDKIHNWFLPLLIDKLINAGKILKDSEVYSLKTMGVLGGDYSVENIQPTDISVHFALTGQISRQISDLPDGTKVNIKVE
jgi:hypothetical protein